MTRLTSGPVREPHLDDGIGPGKVDADQFAYGAPPPVAPRHVTGTVMPEAIRRDGMHADAVLIGDEPGDLRFPVHDGTELG